MGARYPHKDKRPRSEGAGGRLRLDIKSQPAVEAHFCPRNRILQGGYMHCLGCLLITEKPVTLRDGTVVCNECEAWRLECEARHAMTLRDKAAYLEDIKRKRGEAAYHLLRNEMLAQKEAAK